MESQTCPSATLKRINVFNESDRAALISDKYALGCINDNQCCPNATPKRPFFEIEIPIVLYRVAKGEWKIRESDHIEQPNEGVILSKEV